MSCFHIQLFGFSLPAIDRNSQLLVMTLGLFSGLLFVNINCADVKEDIFPTVHAPSATTTYELKSALQFSVIF